MNIDAPVRPPSHTPGAAAVRRFWIAWLALLLATLVGFTFIILVAAVMAEPVAIPPTG